MQFVAGMEATMTKTDDKEQQAGLFDDAEIISVYTRAQAIEDGTLVDVSEMAREAGFAYPVAVTQAVWANSVAVPDGVRGQDEAGRCWDLLSMARWAARAAPADQSVIYFRLHVRNDNRNRTPPLVTLKAICGPDDDGAPCVTILMPEED
jgi:hypothetical protein